MANSSCFSQCRPRSDITDIKRGSHRPSAACCCIHTLGTRRTEWPSARASTTTTNLVHCRLAAPQDQPLRAPCWQQRSAVHALPCPQHPQSAAAPLAADLPHRPPACAVLPAARQGCWRLRPTLSAMLLCLLQHGKRPCAVSAAGTLLATAAAVPWPAVRISSCDALMRQLLQHLSDQRQ